MLRLSVLILVAVSAFARPLNAASFPDSLIRLDGGGFLAPQAVAGVPVLLVFWDEACTPCHAELRDLPRMALQNRDVRFVLVALREGPRERTMFAPSAAAGVVLTRAPLDPRSMLRRMGNPESALPFSAAFDARGQQCGRHLGMLTQQAVREVINACRR